ERVGTDGETGEVGRFGCPAPLPEVVAGGAEARGLVPDPPPGGGGVGDAGGGVRAEEVRVGEGPARRGGGVERLEVGDAVGAAGGPAGRNTSMSARGESARAWLRASVWGPASRSWGYV